MNLVIFVGLQATGKSTFFRTYFADTHVQVSKDHFRNNRNPARRQTQLINQALQSEHSVVVDNTNPTIEERRPLIYLGQAYNAEIIGYYFESGVKCCLDRNQQRFGKARVPDMALYATQKKLTPPSAKEGFDQLFCVRIAGDNFTFEVRPWTEAAIASSPVM